MTNKKLKTTLAFLAIILGQLSGTTFAAEGGNAGGGGNSRRSTLADVADIKGSIFLAQNFSELLVNGLDMTLLNTNEMSEVDPEYIAVSKAILKNGAKSAVSISKNAKIKIQNSACPSPRGPTQASADRKTQSICFSLGEILKQKHTAYEIDAKMAALYLHELAHLIDLGSSKEAESQAEVFQEVLVKVLIYYNFEDVMNRHNQFVYETSDSLQDFGRRFKGQNLCDFENKIVFEEQKLFSKPTVLFADAYPQLKINQSPTDDFIGMSPVDAPTWLKLGEFTRGDCKSKGSAEKIVELISNSLPSSL